MNTFAKMKKTILQIVTIGTVLSALATQAGLTLSLTGDSGSSIQFNGNGTANGNATFQFNDSTAGASHQWVTTIGGHTYTGSFGGTTWTYDKITSLFGGVVQYASVETTAATLTIYDATGGKLTGSFTWGNILTLNSAGSTTAASTLNLGVLTYSGGTDATLSALNGDKGSLNLSFQFSPNETLSSVSTGGKTITSYNGLITVVPEASTTFAGFGAVGLVLFIVVQSRRSRVAPASK
jgi:hypothetical protein